MEMCTTPWKESKAVERQARESRTREVRVPTRVCCRFGSEKRSTESRRTHRPQINKTPGSTSPRSCRCVQEGYVARMAKSMGLLLLSPAYATNTHATETGCLGNKHLLLGHEERNTTGGCCAIVCARDLLFSEVWKGKHIDSLRNHLATCAKKLRTKTESVKGSSLGTRPKQIRCGTGESSCRGWVNHWEVGQTE